MIRTMLQLASAVWVVAALVALPGCGGSKSPASKTPSAKPASSHHEGDGHDHSKDKDDHSGHDHEKEGKTK
jgi:predicted small lipoprotein YifL